MEASEVYDYDADDPFDCFQCGGEGFVWDCFDGMCFNAEDGCDDCTRPCPECARRKRAAKAKDAQPQGSPQAHVAPALAKKAGIRAARSSSLGIAKEVERN